MTKYISRYIQISKLTNQILLDQIPLEVTCFVFALGKVWGDMDFDFSKKWAPVQEYSVRKINEFN